MEGPFRITVLPGDGVGPEVTAGARLVLEAAARAFGLPLEIEEHPVGWAAVQATGSALPSTTLEACLASGAVLLGAIGHPDADDLPPGQRPEAALLQLRRALGCFANLRPLKVMDGLVEASPLRPERVRGVDLIIVRELAGGLYYGEPRGISGEGDLRSATNTLRYSREEIRRVAEIAFNLAARRAGRLVSVDKANVLETSRLWRQTVEEVAAGHPDVALEHMLVDRVAMELVLRPRSFDVLLTPNLFGDILSDEAAGVAGSLGLLPSASLGDGPPLFEPVHGSAPDIAGGGIANPIGAILSASMLLGHALRNRAAAEAVERSVEEAIAAGLRTRDLTGGEEGVTRTLDFARWVAERIPAEATPPARAERNG